MESYEDEFKANAFVQFYAAGKYDLYKEMFDPEVDEDDIEWKVPQSSAEVAEVMGEFKRMGLVFPS